MNKKTFINLWQPIDEESKQDGLDKDFIIDLNDLITSAVEEERSNYAREQLKKFAQVRIDIQKAERERCAVIAETWIIGKIIWTDDLKVILLEIAKAIRSKQ